MSEDGYRPPVVVFTKRPTYEKQENIDHELLFCSEVHKISDITARRVKKKLYPCDLLFVKEKNIIAFVEFKRRLGVFSYPNVILSLDKASRLLSFAGITGDKAGCRDVV